MFPSARGSIVVLQHGTHSPTIGQKLTESHSYHSLYKMQKADAFELLQACVRQCSKLVPHDVGIVLCFQKECRPANVVLSVTTRLSLLTIML